MLNIITDTETIVRDGHEVTVTAYAVAGYALVRVKSSERARVEWRVRAPHDLPAITDTSAFMADVPVFGVNWSAQGTRSTTDARAYAALLAAAADVADAFNIIVADN